MELLHGGSRNKAVLTPNCGLKKNMHSNTALMVFLLVAIMATRNFGEVIFPSKSSTDLPIEITTAKPIALSSDRSHRNSGNGLSRKKVDDNPEGVDHSKNAIDRLDTAATHHSPVHVPVFGIRNGQDSFSALHGYHPLNSRGFLIPDSLLQLFAVSSFPYLTAPLLCVVPCSLECEHFAIPHRNAFPFFQHNIGSRPVHDLGEYHGPHHTTPGFQSNRFPYATLGNNRPEQDVVRNTGGPQFRYPSDGKEVDHTKIPPNLLPDRINGQYSSQQL